MRVLHCVAIKTPFCCLSTVYSVRKDKFLSTVLSIVPNFLLIINFRKGVFHLNLQK